MRHNELLLLTVNVQREVAKVRVIAEAGVNHNGSLEMALHLVDAAAEAGADYVKFQTFKAEKLVTRAARKAEYQKKNTGYDDDSQLLMLKKLELSEEDHRSIMDRCKERGIGFLSTPFDLDSIDFLHSLGVRVWKIPSGDITNYPYLRKIARLNEEIIMSTGMCDDNDIEAALGALTENGQDITKVTLLHCTTQYPTPMEDVNLRAMLTLGRYVKDYGYSDHTQGIEVPVAAVAMGASVIEKHFTLSRVLPGPDHKASLEPDELSAMVRSIRNIEKAMGDGSKHAAESEIANKAIARKSIVASRFIKKGERLSEENLTTKRPGTGISPMHWKEIIDTVAMRDFEEDEIIEA